MIRYGKYSNATLALNFGFTLSRNIYDQVNSHCQEKKCSNFQEGLVQILVSSKPLKLVCSKIWHPDHLKASVIK